MTEEKTVTFTLALREAQRLSDILSSHEDCGPGGGPSEELKTLNVIIENAIKAVEPPDPLASGEPATPTRVPVPVPHKELEESLLPGIQQKIEEAGFVLVSRFWRDNAIRELASLIAAASAGHWPEPQPITDAQRDGNTYLLWWPGGTRAHIVFCGHEGDGETTYSTKGVPDPISFGPVDWPPGWYQGFWGPEICERVPGFSIATWNLGDRGMRAGVVLFGNCTHYLPVPRPR